MELRKLPSSSKANCLKDFQINRNSGERPTLYNIDSEEQIGIAKLLVIFEGRRKLNKKN